MPDYTLRALGRNVYIDVYKGEVVQHTTQSGTQVSSFRNNIYFHNWNRDSLILKLEDGSEESVSISNIDLNVRNGNTVSVYYAGFREIKYAVALFNHSTRDLYFSASGAADGIKLWSFGNLLNYWAIVFVVFLVAAFSGTDIYTLLVSDFNTAKTLENLVFAGSILAFPWGITSYIVRKIRFAKLRNFIRNLQN